MDSDETDFDRFVTLAPLRSRLMAVNAPFPHRHAKRTHGTVGGVWTNTRRAVAFVLVVVVVWGDVMVCMCFVPGLLSLQQLCFSAALRGVCRFWCGVCVLCRPFVVTCSVVYAAWLCATLVANKQPLPVSSFVVGIVSDGAGLKDVVALTVGKM